MQNMIGIADLNRLIDRLKFDGRSRQNDLHKAAVGALFHALKDGQVTPSNNLVNAMTKAERPQAFIAWLGWVAPKVFSNQKGVIKMRNNWQDAVTDAGGIEAIIEKAQETPFFDRFKEQKAEQYFAAEKAVKATIRNLEKRKQEASEAGMQQVAQQFQKAIEAFNLDAAAADQVRAEQQKVVDH